MARQAYPDHGPMRDIAPGAAREVRLARGWVAWCRVVPSPFPHDPDYHEHEHGAQGGLFIQHRHKCGTQPHDHTPPLEDLL